MVEQKVRGIEITVTHRPKMRVFSCVLLFFFVHHRTGATSDGRLLISHTDGDSASIAGDTNIAPELKPIKFPLRKCCPSGKVYHQLKYESQNMTERCREHSNVFQQSSIFIKISQELFFSKLENSLASSDETDFNITFGFPENCKKSIFLEPDAKLSYRFYPLFNGDLVVPSRFQIFPPESYCMEDSFADDDYNKVKRVAIVCVDNARAFPADAIDDANRLQLNFLDDLNKTKGLTDLLGRRVIQKCCDINEVYSLQSFKCIPKQSYATEYFGDLLKNNGNLFVRTDLLNCSRQDLAEYFVWAKDFKVQVKMDSVTSLDEHLYTTEEYCIEDFVTFPDGELPEAITLAAICLQNEIRNQTPGRNSPDSTVRIPKCCFHGYNIDGGCVEIEKPNTQGTTLEPKFKNAMEALMLPEPFHAQVEFEIYDNLGCGYDNFLPVPLSLNASVINAPIPRFTEDEQHNTTLVLNYYQENSRTFDVKIAHFCVDTMKIQAQEGKNTSYEPHVFFCFLPSHNSGQHPALVLFSTISLIFTCFMYIFTPAKGAAINDRQQYEACHDTMASQVSGRNLLCHISSLCLAFVCLAVAQQGLVKPGDSGCIAIGYITYGATMASFAWFTVYCFHSFCMFRETARNNIVFVPYLLFGWGIPVMALVIASVAQFHPKSSLPQSINPNMGSLRCWFGNEKSLLIFFYAPICCLLGLSIIFLLNLLPNYIMRCRTKKPTESRQRTIHRMAIKFMIITGIPWGFETAVWMASYFANVPKQRDSLQRLSEVGSVLNALRGVFIFSLFVLFEPNVRAQLFFFLLKIFRKPSGPAKKEDRRTETVSSERNATNHNSTASYATNNSTSARSKNEELPASKIKPDSFEPCESTAL